VSSETVPQPEGLGGLFPEHVSGFIEVNPERLNRVARVAGFLGNVAIVPVEDPNGSADDTFLSKPEFDSSHSRLSLTHKQPELTISINRGELERHVALESARTGDEISAWARQTNRALTSALRKAVWPLNMRVQSGELSVSAAMSVTAVVLSALPYAIGYVAPRVAYFASGLLPKRLRPTDMCWSLFPAIHPDRALVAHVLSYLPIVKRVVEKP